MARVAITPRSFRHATGAHFELLDRYGLESVFPPTDEPLDERAMKELVHDCDALIVGTDPVNEAVLSSGPLRAVVKFGSGLDNIDEAAAGRLGIPVVATPGANARSVAELAIGMMLVLARHIVFHHHAVRARNWEQRIGIELKDRRLGLIGYGAVGREVAAIARCLGMEVVAFDPYARDIDVPTIGLRDLLSSCDVISLHAPLTDETSALINGDALSLMTRGALLINTARGGLIDEEALADALESGHLAGAALDVFEREPPESSRLLSLDNVIVSPHAGAATAEAVERAGSLAVREAARLLGLKGRGRPRS
jgi:phosphoglycerate dehydrogenase-like enzyme